MFIISVQLPLCYNKNLLEFTCDFSEVGNREFSSYARAHVTRSSGVQVRDSRQWSYVLFLVVPRDLDGTKTLSFYRIPNNQN